MIKLIIADDHIMFRQGLAAFLIEDKEFEIIGEASNGHEVLSLLLKQKPDVIVTDIEMPEMNGIELTKEIQKSFPEIPVIGLTVYEDDYLVAEMFQSGAKGYLIKRSTKDQMKEAIRIVRDNGYYFCQTTSLKLARLLAASTINPFKTKEPESLSDVERTIIQLTCEGLTNKEIGDRMHLGKRTIDTYRYLLYQKLEIKNLAELIIYAIRTGIYTP